MFTGIVEELGEVVAMTGSDAPTRDRIGADSAVLSVRGPVVAADAGHGDSIAVNGVCLTVTDVADGVFTADVMGESLRRTSLGALRVGSQVNLERAATLSTRLGGHLVQGHVDGVGQVLSREAAEAWETLWFSLPPQLARYVVEKGSITVDGVSLTVMQTSDDAFAVGLIPTTLKLTVLGSKQVGDQVNLEVDVLAKYVERLLTAPGPGAAALGVAGGAGRGLGETA